MDARQYEAISRPFREHPAALRALTLINDGLKYLCYVLYPVLLVLLAVNEPSELLRAVLTPAVLFVGLSAFRRLYDAPRPYEALEIDPLIHKSTKGKSFPSRHIFSIFMIAMCWLAYWWPLGVVLLICGAFMAAIRVSGGVPYPKDVISGALVAILGGIVGLWMLPLSWF